jgi:tryptophan halogenase
MESIRKKIIIVGSGNAGLISALILGNKFPHFFIEIISSDDIGTIGVGEGSTEHFRAFVDFCRIDVYQLIKEAKATFKAGIMFEGWTKKPYLHSIIEYMSQHIGDYHHYYAYLFAKKYPFDQITEHSCWENKFHERRLQQQFGMFYNQFHFDSLALNKYLRQLCIDAEMTFHEDKIISYKQKKNGDINYLVGNKKRYKGDYYIDCTGFRKELIKKIYKVPFKSMKDYLILDKAFAFQTKNPEDNYNLWTLARAMGSGWNWKIPTQERYGNGYVYCSDFITDDEAIQEINTLYKQDIKINKTFKFEPGYTTKTWTHNCIAIGLSSNFVEPLEATSLGSTIQQVFALASFLASNDKDSFNRHCDIIYKNLCDFVLLHYLVKKEDTKFWKHIKHNLKLTDSLSYLLEIGTRRLLQRTDFPLSYHLFGSANFNLVMHALGLLNPKQELDLTIYPFMKERIEKNLKDYYIEGKHQKNITHKEAITRVMKDKGLL